MVVRVENSRGERTERNEKKIREENLEEARGEENDGRKRRRPHEKKKKDLSDQKETHKSGYEKCKDNIHKAKSGGLPFSLDQLSVHRDEGAGEGSLADEAAQEIGEHKSVDEGVPLPGGAKVMRACDVANHSEDAACERECSDQSCRLQQFRFHRVFVIARSPAKRGDAGRSSGGWPPGHPAPSGRLGEAISELFIKIPQVRIHFLNQIELPSS